MEEQNTNGNGYFKGNIDARMSNVEENVEKILNNHLPHIQEHLEKQDSKLDRILWAVTIASIGLIGNLAYNLITH